MDDQARLLLDLVARISLVILCYFVVVKKSRCGEYCSLFRQRMQSTLGWISGAVATVGLFYPVACGVLSLLLLVAIYTVDIDYGSKAATVRATAKSSQVGDARG